MPPAKLFPAIPPSILEHKHEGDPPWQEHLDKPEPPALLFDPPAVQQRQLPTTSEGAVRFLMESGATPESVREWAGIIRDLKADQAAEDYSLAIAEFQSRCGIIGKHRQAGQGNFAYKYASYDDIMVKIAPLLKECGLVISFSSEQAEKGLKITCRIRKGIHFEDSTMTVPIPDMKVNDTMKMGAAQSFAKRYCLCGALNLVIGDEDLDAGNLGASASDEDIATLREWLESTDTKLDRFLKWAGVADLDAFPAARLDEAIHFLKAKAHR